MPPFTTFTETGVLPPVTGKPVDSLCFPYGAYDDSYRDCNMRAPGEPGFIPPLQQLAGLQEEEAHVRFPEGYDQGGRNSVQTNNI